MDALLERVLEAHGGLDPWKKLSTLSARITYGGPFWEFKGHADFVGTVTVDRIGLIADAPTNHGLS
jgi:hypothetical protein